MALKGFDIETAPLTEVEETELLPIIVSRLKTAIGKHNAVKNGYLCDLLSEYGFDSSEARVRKIIRHIRVNGYVKRLIATSAGYYISNNYNELHDYIDSLIGREEAIHSLRESIEIQTEAFFDTPMADPGTQLTLF